MRRTARLIAVLAAVLAAVLLAVVLAGWMTLRASLPILDGSAPLHGLGAAVLVERDAAGVPTISASSRADLARALGYLHAQDRFFQMDLARRAAAGELSALLGPALLPTDRDLRVHQFRQIARRAVAGLDPETRALLDAYADGVNSGLTALGSRPFEYWLLQSVPQAWRAEDSVLCIEAMFLQLQDSHGHLQLQRGLLHATLPAPLAAFLDAGAPEWDAAVDGSRADEPRIPSAAEFNLRALEGLPVRPPPRVERELEGVGSNNWAVAGARGADGAAVVANDMHLGYRVPTIWYRARLIQRAAGEAALDLTGVTLPGTAGLVAGSNRRIAWGFTNSYGEFERVIRLVAASAPGDYATAHGPQPLRTVTETIEVRGAPSEQLSVRLTGWGPVVGNDWEGRPYALQWTAQDPAALNFKLIELERARSVAEALELASAFGMPGQNLMVADRSGHIGWTIAGRIPNRSNEAPDMPQLSTDAAVGLDGWLAPGAQPRIVDPPSGLLWSANARVIGGAGAALIGDDGLDRGARAAQIEHDLEHASSPFTARSSLAIQTDDRALFLERWHTLLTALIERLEAGGNHAHAPARAVLAAWSGHAAPGDAAFRLVWLFRQQVEARAYYMLVAPARQRAPDYSFEIPTSFEGPLWRLMEQRPLNLLSADYADWDAFLTEALQASERLPRGCRDLASCTWGTVNAVKVRHPLSRALPLLSAFLDMPTVEVAGAHADMPRVQGPDFGASERFSVAPGHEEMGYFHMPGGQSGHPLSPFYRAGFEAWARAEPTPFLPGPRVHALTLTP